MTNTLDSQEKVDSDRESNIQDASLNSPWGGTGETPYLENNFGPTKIGSIDTGETDTWTTCETSHIYSVATSVPNGDINNMRLYDYDILIGMEASDTSGGFETSFHNDSASRHKVSFTVYHTNAAGTMKVVMDNYHLAGGNSDTGLRYVSFLPWEPGTYTIVFNETVAAGDCAMPDMPYGEWGRFTVNILPPEENQGSIPDWSVWNTSDFQGLLDDFNSAEGMFGEEPVEPVDILKVVAVCGLLAGVVILLFR